MSNFKQLPTNLKPREKLKYLGENALTPQELLAIIIQSGNHKYSVMQVSQMLFEKYHTIDNILNQSIKELCNNPGIGEVKALNLKAIKALMDKSNVKIIDSVVINRPEDILPSIKYLEDKKQEHLVIINIDSRYQIISQEEIFIGTINEINIHPREIFAKAIHALAYGIIIVHNHPSGDCSPSENDIISTRKLVEIGKFLNVLVLDHIIISNNGYYSMKENCDIIT